MNRRLAVPIILLLLFLCAGSVWALLGPLHLAQKLAVEKPLTAQGAQPGAPASETKSDSKPEPSSDTKHAEANPAPVGDAAFDVVRIDPKGTSVFAGRTEPGAQVTITGDGKKLGTTQADENGEWTFAVEEKFASNDPKLDLEVKPAAEVKKEAVATAAATTSAGPTSVPQGAPATAADAGAPHTASAVTAHLLKDLQGMVNEARSENAQEPTVKAQTDQPTAPGVAAGQPAQAGATQGSAPRAGTASQAAALSPPTVPEPNSDGGNVTAAKVAAPAPGETERKSIPVPITFVFNEAQFTSDGRKAADLLLEYLKLKSFKKIALTGHADERGSDELNMSLSRDRLETVAGFLKQGGFSGDLELVPKGKTEPYSGVVRSEYNLEELYQLDRRVELVVKP
jgi:outer membrane protein OmpA-like peptidoglycan-associated protein